MKQDGDLPPDFVLKTSVTLAAANPAAGRVFEDLGATSLNLPVDLTLPQIAAIRQAVDIPIDYYVESPDDFGGAVRHYEIPEIVRVAAPIYLKFGLRNSRRSIRPASISRTPCSPCAASGSVAPRSGSVYCRRYAPDAVASPLAVSAKA